MSLPDFAPVRVPASAPERIGSRPVVGVIEQPGTRFVLYGSDFASSSAIVALGPKGRVRYAFDLLSFGYPPRSLAGLSPYGPQEIVWARQVGQTLLVAHAHASYARESGNRNGYLTAIDLHRKRVRWRSPSLVANAYTFVVVGDAVVTGYGFTAEGDWLYLLDLNTGRIEDRLPLPSAPETIERRGRDRLVVQTYDARVVVRLRPA